MKLKVLIYKIENIEFLTKYFLFSSVYSDCKKYFIISKTRFHWELDRNH